MGKYQNPTRIFWLSVSNGDICQKKGDFFTTTTSPWKFGSHHPIGCRFLNCCISLLSWCLVCHLYLLDANKSPYITQHQELKLFDSFQFFYSIIVIHENMNRSRPWAARWLRSFKNRYKVWWKVTSSNRQWFSSNNFPSLTFVSINDLISKRIKPWNSSLSHWKDFSM